MNFDTMEREIRI